MGMSALCYGYNQGHMKKRNPGKKCYRIFQKYFREFLKWNALS